MKAPTLRTLLFLHLSLQLLSGDSRPSKFFRAIEQRRLVERSGVVGMVGSAALGATAFFFDPLKVAKVADLTCAAIIATVVSTRGTGLICFAFVWNAAVLDTIHTHACCC